MANHGYARERLTLAVDILVAAPGPIRDRLQEAYLTLQDLKADDFRDDGQSRLWAGIREDLISNQTSQSGRGYLRDTLEAMDDSEAQSIAKRFLKLNGLAHES
jgi:hypothetical protein